MQVTKAVSNTLCTVCNVINTGCGVIDKGLSGIDILAETGSIYAEELRKDATCDVTCNQLDRDYKLAVAESAHQVRMADLSGMVAE